MCKITLLCCQIPSVIDPIEAYVGLMILLLLEASMCICTQYMKLCMHLWKSEIDFQYLPVLLSAWFVETEPLGDIFSSLACQ